jgi:hypothetical protein
MRISAVLSNRHYLGQIKHGKSWIKGLYEPIVDEQTFNKAQEETALRRTTSIARRSISSITNSLRRLVNCPKCSRKLSIGTDMKQIDRLCKQVTTYYRCRSNALHWSSDSSMEAREASHRRDHCCNEPISIDRFNNDRSS